MLEPLLWLLIETSVFAVCQAFSNGHGGGSEVWAFLCLEACCFSMHGSMPRSAASVGPAAALRLPLSFLLRLTMSMLRAGRGVQ